jgi:hypothetical protein
MRFIVLPTDPTVVVLVIFFGLVGFLVFKVGGTFVGLVVFLLEILTGGPMIIVPFTDGLIQQKMTLP